MQDGEVNAARAVNGPMLILHVNCIVIKGETSRGPHQPVNLTGVIEQRLVLAVFGGGNQIPDEALDLVVPFIMSQTVDQQSSAHTTSHAQAFRRAENPPAVILLPRAFRSGRAYLQITSMSLSARCHLNRPWFKMSFHRPHLHGHSQSRKRAFPAAETRRGP